MAYTASQLLQDAFRKLGITTTGVATGGSASTVVDTSIGDKYSDNTMNGAAMFIVRDAGGASAAPEGEWGTVSAYTQSTNTFNISTLTAAVGVGDVYMFTLPYISLYEMLELANLALKSLGDIAVTDASITTASNQTEYALPVALKREDILRIDIQTITTDSNDNRYVPITNWDIIPAAPGSTGLLVIPQYASGYTVRIIYNGAHPTLTAYNSTISETIHPELISDMLVKMALGWYNGRTSGSEDYWIQKENEYTQKVEVSRVRFPIWKPTRQTKWFSAGQTKVADEPPPIPLP